MTNTEKGRWNLNNVIETLARTHILINHFSLFKSAWGSYAMNNTGKIKTKQKKKNKRDKKKRR